MTDKRWEFELDQTRHSVELEHNTFSNKRSVRVDGRLLTLSPESRQPKERSGKHAFRINGHACEVRINYADRKYVYDLLLDGVSDTPEMSTLEKTAVPASKDANQGRWTAIGFLLFIGLGVNLLNWYWAHSKGYYLEELAYIAPIMIFLAVYFMVYPQDFFAQYAGRISARMWVALILSFLFGFANHYAFAHGLY